MTFRKAINSSPSTPPCSPSTIVGWDGHTRPARGDFRAGLGRAAPLSPDKQAAKIIGKNICSYSMALKFVM